MTPQQFEAKVRRMAERVGLRLCKSRIRNETDPQFGMYCLVDRERNFAVYGSHWFAFAATLEDCADYLRDALAA